MKRIFFIAIILFLHKSLLAQVDIHYQEIGSGDPVIIINGGPGWSSKHMLPVAERIADMGYKVVLYDQRGTGASAITADSTTITFDLMVEDIELLRQKLGYPIVTIYGHSFGGMLAMAYAAKYPNKVRKLILSAPGGYDLSFLDYYPTNLNYALSDEEKKQVSFWSNPQTVAADLGKSSYHIIKNTISAFLFHKNLVDSIMLHIDENTWSINTANFVWQDLYATSYSLKNKLYKIKAPTLILQGRQDVLGQENPMTIANLIPHSRLVFLEESAHLMWLDNPQEYFKDIEQFLKSPDADYSNKEAGKYLQLMAGTKKIDAKIFTKKGALDVEGSASFVHEFNGVKELFKLIVSGKEISGKAFIKYSDLYCRFELFQIDNAAGSFVILNGAWDKKSQQLIFEPINAYSQWGSYSTLKLKWIYEFHEDGSFKKTMMMPDENGQWITQSYYGYY